MDFEKQTGESIEKAFAKFDSENPKVYELFVRFALEWINNYRARGRAIRDIRISSKQIVGRIRWETNVKTTTGLSDDYKINDAFTAHYARKFLTENPQFVWWNDEESCEAGIFEIRKLRAKGKLSLSGS